MYVPIDKETSTWDGYTFILPCVAVGNVGQLAADLLVATLQMKRVGSIYHEGILPLVGNDPFSDHKSKKCTMITSCEMYEDTENKLLILQQRSPFVKGKKKLFALWLDEWIKEHKFKQIIILTSLFAEDRLDSQLEGSQFRYLASDSIEKEYSEKLSNSLGLNKLEKRIPPQGIQAEESLYMRGGGVAKRLYESLARSIPVLVLMKFCSEGDNAGDAVDMVQRLDSWLNTTKPKNIESKPSSNWIIPSSWRLVFGTRADKMLFH